MRTVVVLFTRDLRVRDHPALWAARGARVVPLFVVDPAIVVRGAGNRLAYLVEALADLRSGLRSRGGDLVVRYGDTVTEALGVAEGVGAGEILLSADVSAFAVNRVRRLRERAPQRVEVREFPGVTVLPPGEVTPSGGGGHYRVFTPYWRVWGAREWRDVVPAPEGVALPAGVDPGGLPGAALTTEGVGELSPERQRGGERLARERMRAWLDGGIGGYERRHDDLPADATSRLSADIRFGCLSPLELARAARERPGGGAYVRQLAWRDFHHQVARAFPGLARRDYRPRRVGWRYDGDDFRAWCAGATGVPIVDAGMRQLRREGFMHNRARLITAMFLTRTLGVHWKLGADFFHAYLTDGDIADNYGNWQWVAGTGNDTRPNRGFNLLRQARRFDPRGDYVRRYVEELARVEPKRIQWPEGPHRPSGYPPPLVGVG